MNAWRDQRVWLLIHKNDKMVQMILLNSSGRTGNILFITDPSDVCVVIVVAT